MLTKSFTTLLFSLLITLNLNAETGYKYIAPDSDYGKLCVNQCKNSQYQCQQLEQLKKENKILQKKQENMAWNQDLMIENQDCMAEYANNKKKQKEECEEDGDGVAVALGLGLLFGAFDDDKPKRKPRNVCKERFLDCFKGCGGKVKTINFDSYQ